MQSKTTVGWNEQYNWFLVDEGKIQYAFTNKKAAKIFQEKSFLYYMLLTNLDKIHEIMIDPRDTSCWSAKIESCVDVQFND